MKTYVVEVARSRAGLDHLDYDDRKDLFRIEDNHRIEAENEEAALDKFHSTVAIACLEDFSIDVREAKPLRKFYVTMTYEQWPEDGSYGTAIMAEGGDDAERLCRREMAAQRADPEDPDMDECSYLDDYGAKWHVVDCFDLEEFIAWHSKKDDTQ